MPEPFEDATLIVAHPDDEVLWASSILRLVRHVVVCYQNDPRNPAKSAGRARVAASFPLDNVTWLGLEEADVFGGVDWSDATLTDEGVAVSTGAAQYAANFRALLDRLPAFVTGGGPVVTHNPWGEYGHADHIQVHRAVTQIAAEAGTPVWGSSYASDRVLPLVTKTVSALGTASTPLPTDKALGAELLALYRENRCWTWTHDYTWPLQELFYEIRGTEGRVRSPAQARDATPLLNIVRFGERPVTRGDVLSYVRQKTVGRFGLS